MILPPSLSRLLRNLSAALSGKFIGSGLSALARAELAQGYGGWVPGVQFWLVERFAGKLLSDGLLDYIAGYLDYVPSGLFWLLVLAHASIIAYCWVNGTPQPVFQTLPVPTGSFS